MRYLLIFDDRGVDQVFICASPKQAVDKAIELMRERHPGQYETLQNMPDIQAEMRAGWEGWAHVYKLPDTIRWNELPEELEQSQEVYDYE